MSVSMKLLLLLALSSAILVQATTPRISIHDCSCVGSCSNTIVLSGECVTNPDSATSRRVRCLSGDAMCAQMLVYRSATCEASFMAGQPSLCGSCSDAHGGYSILQCNPETGDARLSTSCDSTCSMCNGTEYSYPYGTCSSHGRGKMGMYNQGLFPCDGVSVEEFDTTDCSGPVKAAYARPTSDGCHINNLTFTCLRAPEPPLETPPATDVVTYAKCPMNSTRCGDECERVSVQSDKCVENPTASRSKYVEMSCGTRASTCATFAVSTGAACSAVMGRERHACGTCSPWFGGNVYSKLDCDKDGDFVQISMGCNADCSSCASAVNETVKKLGCFSRTSPRYTYSLNFQGFEPCATVEVREYGDDSTCQTPTARYPVVRDECDLFHTATCGSVKSKAKLSGGAIAGIAVGCVAFVALIIAGAVVYRMCCRKPTGSTAAKKAAAPETPNCPTD